MPSFPSSRCAYAGLALLVFIPLTARAGCVWTDLVTEQTSVAVIRPAAPRMHFYDDRQVRSGCPATGAACRSGSSVTSGDIVLTGPVQGAFTCAGARSAGRSATIGWLPTAELSPLPEADRIPADWTGHWVGDQEIIIAPGKEGGLVVKGTGTGGRDHVGEVSGEARPLNNVLAFTMGDDGTLAYTDGDEMDCRIAMWRRGPYLVVRDNRQCGGVSVTFAGFYRRAP